MSRQIFTAIVCIILSIGGLISTGCGLFSYPSDGAKALAANTTFIQFQVHIVDEAGQPLDGVTVKVVRHALEANIIIWGTYDQSKPDSPRVVDKTFTYGSLGNCAVEVTFSKPDYADVIATYANVDVIEVHPVQLVGPSNHEDYSCINVSHHPTQTIILTKNGKMNGANPLPPGTVVK